MARRRFLHPDFFHDESLVTMPPFTRLLFAGLWCLADRSGRTYDKPVKIKMQLFPADTLDVDAALADLAAAGMVTRYAVNGEKFLQVNKFDKYQHPHPGEAKSVIPAPTGTNSTRADVNRTRADCNSAGYTGSSDTQDLRIHGTPDGAPTAPPSAARNVPLGARSEHRNHAVCGRVCLPAFLYREFVKARGGPEDEARRDVDAWALGIIQALPDDSPIGDEPLTFWRLRWQERCGTTRKFDRPGNRSPNPSVWDQLPDDWCDHDPRCNSREWHTMRAAQDDADPPEDLEATS